MTLTESPTKDNRSLAIGLSLGAAACMIYACGTRHWLVNSSNFEEIGFGLRTNFVCASTQCKEMSNAAFVDAWRDAGSTAAQYVSSAFSPAGWITLVECLLAALGLLGGAGLAFARKQPDLPITPTTIALLGCMAGLITGCVFVATKPGPPGFVGVGMSFWMFGVGSVVGILGAQLAAKVNRPADPDLLNDAMSPDQF